MTINYSDYVKNVNAASPMLEEKKKKKKKKRPYSDDILKRRLTQATSNGY
jgi:hypothetical protein